MRHEKLSLNERFDKSLEGLDPFRKAKKIGERVYDAGKDIGTRIYRTEAEKELNEYDAHACQLASDMLYKLGIEVERLRQLILHYDHGRIDKRDMVKATQNWNGDPAG